jgi:pimeloyl-ACP methyl ester carboxylesterase
MAEQILDKTISRDGTPIAYWRSGHGPALVLVHGSTADHTRWARVLPLLEPHRTVLAMDRRGRGASGDSASYSLDAEAADVVAVVEAAAAAGGAPVDVFGHSYGGHCALEAALQTTGMRQLALYEPAIIPVTTPEFTDGLERLLAEGRREEVLLALFRDLLQMPEDHLALLTGDPSWPGRVAAAHTLVRECRAEEAYRFDPARFADLHVPTLLMAGEQSPPEMAKCTVALAAALPRARVVTLAGEGHVAMTSAPELFARELLAYLHEG